MATSDGTVSAFRLDNQTLARAVRHHRRAIAALEGALYANLNARVRYAMLQRLRTDLLAFEAAMADRGFSQMDGADEDAEECPV